MITVATISFLLATTINALPQSYPYGNQGAGGSGSRPQGGGGGGGGGGRGGVGGGVSGGPVIPIISDNREGPIDGVYSFDFETGDGIKRQEQGSPTGPDGAVVQQGSWSFTFPDGTPAQFSFVADEGGYRVESPLLPTPHPLPAHAIEQIKKAEAERAQGIIHDGQYRPEEHDIQQFTRPNPKYQQYN